jgi:amino acid adenylation domain-containing protein
VNYREKAIAMSFEETDLLCASFAQQRLWFLDRLESGTSLYNIPMAWRLEGVVDADALRRSLTEIVRRHEVLRTTFVVEGDELKQCVTDRLDVAFEQEDFSATAGAEALALQRATELGQVGFDLERGPLLRVTLLRIDQRTHVLHLVVHHIVSDGWSMGRLVHELELLYEAFSSGRPSPLQQLPIQYADYAAWQCQWLDGPVLDEQLAFWRRTLEGAPTLLELPLDRPRPLSLSHHGAAIGLELDTDRTAALVQLARAHRSTLFMVMAAAFSVLLHRYSRQNDICIGYAAANRRRAEVADLIGLFINTLVLRTRIDTRLDFLGLLTQTREAILDADAHQDLPFEKLVEELRPERSLNYSPLFQVMLLLQDSDTRDGGSTLDLPGLRAQGLPHRTSTAKFDLTMEWLMLDGRLSGAIEYNTALFDPTTVAQMAAHFQALLDSIIANPRACVAELSMLTPEERRHQLVQWHDAHLPPQAERCAHELFDERVRATPDAVAVVFEDHHLSYRELDGRANQLAHTLRELGVRPDVLVGICVERSLDMVVGLLGILKAGGAYVPLDPDYPAQRLAHMLRDTAAPVLLTHQRLLASLPKHDAHTLLLDTHWDRIAQQPASTPDNLTRPEHLVYCIYTSGSTGLPKGAMNTHRGFVNLVHWYFGPDLPAEAQERVMLSSSLSFDLTQKNVLGTLMYGATLIVPSGSAADAQGFHAAARRHQPTQINCAPSAYRLYRSHGELPTVRNVVLGGEPVDAGLVAEFADSDVTLVNSYGPTECADVAVAHVSPPGAAAGGLPLGRPIPNVQIYVVDADLTLAPAGVAGELCISGIGVGRGYISRPELTAERFVPNPYGAPGSRMYRTGDIARHRRDGTLEFLGRIDHQVKIRGLRIELGEIESILNLAPGLREAIVLARTDEHTDPRLVAYLVAAPEGRPGIESLRAHLQRSLPSYMLPSAWVFLDAFPLNPNGKIDRAALPVPMPSSDSLGVDHVAPRNPTEELLAGIWAEVLKVQRIGVHDNFFTLGGHSLMATQVLARIRHALKFDVNLRSLFESPTVAELARHLLAQDNVQKTQEVRSDCGAPAINRLLDNFQLCFTFQQNVPSDSSFNIPVLLKIRKSCDHLEAILADFVSRNNSCRLMPHGNGLRLKPLDCFRVERVALDVRSVDEVCEIAAALAAKPFDIENELLCSFIVITTATSTYLACIFHHAAFDGESIDHFLTGLDASLESGRPEWPCGTDMLVEMQQMDDWQSRGNRIRKFWQRYLGRHALDLGPPLPPLHFEAGQKSVVITFNKEATERFRKYCVRNGATTFVAILNAWLWTLGKFNPRHLATVGFPFACRTTPALANAIGYINTQLAITLSTAAADCHELLPRTKRHLVAVLDHGTVPQRVVREHGKHGLSNNPTNHWIQAKIFYQRRTGQVPTSYQSIELPAAEEDKSLVRLLINEGAQQLDFRIEADGRYIHPDVFDLIGRNLAEVMEGLV